ncbi:MAG: RNA polymerase sigma factor RpoE [Bacteroidales bacterium]|jgi:RNA polymerase sigma-70 factor (ECF subfamily)|nr:RNA polymerase sigma factor RpoE [Gammaproteobacteria bacterium]MDG1135745.1 RNA polymerase sigma factor RpoE [Bacteroidales bacterium]|tara:strand:+ start:659 stop:1288 length:630 start_codon:yes stop_codon:yes gene_type:complete
MVDKQSKKQTNKEADLALVRRAKKGDYRAFDLLVLKYQSRIVSIAFKFVKEIQLAEDISQESFIKAYRSIDSFREESAFYTWLYRITANTAKNYLVSKGRRKESSISELSISENEDFFELPTNDSPEQILMAQSLKDTIYDALSGLPEDTRTALSLREFEGLNYEEIAEIMNCPVGTVRSRIFRGREALENLISPITDKFKVMNNKEIV